MIKSLHLIKTSTGAGWAFRLVKHLQKLGVDNTVVLPISPPGFADQYKKEGIRVSPGQMDIAHQPWEIASKIRALRDIISEVNPDIIHSHFVGTTMTARIALKNFRELPLVFQIPGPLHLENRLSRCLDFWSAGPNDYYVASADYTRRLLLEYGISGKRVFLSHYGADLPDMQPKRSGRLRDELSIGPNDPLVGMVAFMYPPKWILGQTAGLKGHETFIRSIALMRRDLPKLVAVIVGTQWGAGKRYEQSLRRLAHRLCGDAIVFTGFRSDVIDIYGDFDVVVHPSLSDNAGGAVESLLCGVPTVASRVGGLADVVIDGKTGRSCVPGSASSVANAIRFMLDNKDLGLAMAKAGQSLIRCAFDIKVTSKQVQDIYDAILLDRRTTA